MAQTQTHLYKRQKISCTPPKKLMSRGFGFHEMHYLEWGDKNAEKTVICVHGFTRNAHDFDFIACDLVQAGYRVICPEIVGRGKSDWLRIKKMYGYPLYVADILTLINKLGITSTDWIGTSMGGLIGMMVESSFPHIINKLVLNDVGAFLPKESLMRIGEHVGQNMTFPDKNKAEEYLKDYLTPFGVKEDSHFNHIMRHSFVIEEDGTYRLAYDPAISHPFRKNNGKQKKMPDLNLWKLWDIITPPTLLLRGEDSDVLTKETAERMAKRDNVELVEFSEVGHAPMLMERKQIETIINWL